MNATTSLERARPEILAPAGSEEMIHAAVENGADAVYFGLGRHNARLRMNNFAVEDLPRIVAGLHERGAKAYITVNTLVFSDELDDCADLLLAISRAGVDAVLVQDLGVARLAAELVPELPVHASTQMTITSAESIDMLRRLGIRADRIVAARETSRRELRKLLGATDTEVEIFVHGAICVAYSGQCLTSEALGGRSANRGECAQACRLPYDIVVDGEARDLGDYRYPLSPKDLAAYEDIPELARMGIASFKIEGRYKTPEYVAATVRSYREAVDRAMSDREAPLDDATRERLAMTFSRGLTGGWLHEVDHQQVVEGRFPKKRGLLVGRVLGAAKGDVRAMLEGALKRGDGVVFDEGRPDEDEQGGRIYGIRVNGEDVPAVSADDARGGIEATLSFEHGRLDTRRIRAGQLLWKTNDPKLDAELKASFEGETVRFQRPVAARVEGRAGEPLRLVLTDWEGYSVAVEDTEPAQAARNRPLTAESLREQLGRMGGTPFRLDALDCRVDGEIMVPLSRLNDMRRRAVEALVAKRRAIGLGRTDDAGALSRMKSAASRSASSSSSASPEAIGTQMKMKTQTQNEISILCRSLEQVEAVLWHGGVHTIYTDFENPKLQREARAMIPRAGGPRFVPATIRIVKPGEAGFVRALLSSEPDAVLVRNLAAMAILRDEAPGLEQIGDFSLNVANELCAKLLLDGGLSTLTPSYDLNIDQLCALLAAAPVEKFEVTLHQHMPMFHMEHCVFCRFLSEGTDSTNCGRPCEAHAVALRDRVGCDHVLKADAGCRNTLFNATAQSAAVYADRLLAAGVRRFRIDLVNENAADTATILDAYAKLLGGHADGRATARRLKAASKLGVTKGTLDSE